MGRYNSNEQGFDDWSCTDCSFNNFARRYNCYECKKPRDTFKDNGSVEGDYPEYRVREGDWDCSNCQEYNFARRQRCFKCNANKNGISEDQFEFRSGDWMCTACGTHNFARRASCFQCRKSRPDVGDWLCSDCHTNNFARRDFCFGCQQPKHQIIINNTDSDRYSSRGGYREDYHNRHYDNRRVDRGDDRARNGDWYCSQAGCNFLNFARRDTCKDCGENKGDVETIQRKSHVQPGDWECPNDFCLENNFAWRTKCYKCDVFKPVDLED